MERGCVVPQLQDPQPQDTASVGTAVQPGPAVLMPDTPPALSLLCTGDRTASHRAHVLCPEPSFSQIQSWTAPLKPAPPGMPTWGLGCRRLPAVAESPETDLGPHPWPGVRGGCLDAVFLENPRLGVSGEPHALSDLELADDPLLSSYK